MALIRSPKAARPPRVALPFDPVTDRASVRPEAWFRSEVHLAWVRTQPCYICGRHHHIAAAHISKGTDGAKGVKPSDIYVLPLCDGFLAGWDFVGCHNRQHNLGEVAFWSEHGGPARAVGAALELCRLSPCPLTRSAALRAIETGDWRPLAA